MGKWFLGTLNKKKLGYLISVLWTTTHWFPQIFLQLKSISQNNNNNVNVKGFYTLYFKMYKYKNTHKNNNNF